MAKRVSKGYTLASTVLVLSVLSMISLWSISHFRETYELFALKQSVQICAIAIQKAKYQSFLLAKQVNICFNEESIVVDDKEYSLPIGISITDEFCIHYNTNGNVSLANTITFCGVNHSVSVVIQIGGGYYEVREIRDL